MEGELCKWVVFVDKKKYRLNPEQYSFLLEHRENKLVVFKDFSINPNYISSIEKQSLTQYEFFEKQKELKELKKELE